MASKKKDQSEESDNINEENLGDNINEADDSFGLPDVAYQPLDAENESESDQGQEYSAGESGSSDFGSSYEKEEDEYDYVPGSYSPPKSEGNKSGMIIGVIVVLLLAAVAIWFFGFHRPAQLAEEAKIEKQRKAAEAQRKRQADLKAEQERIQREEAELLAAQEAEAAAEPEEGSIETISSRTGRYHVVVASSVDGDLAMDFAKKLSLNGKSVTIIEPYGKVLFYRVTIHALETWDEAQSQADALKGEYGDGVWVIKY